MAASLLPSSRGEDFREQFLSCSICTEPYDNGEHQAKCLPCLHTYCKSCLQQHARRRPKFNCPTCRNLITSPGGTIDSLPNNFIVENLKEYQDLINSEVFCGNCNDNGNHAVSFCHDCGCFQCQGCVDNHQKMRALNNHKLSTMAELQQRANPSVMQQQHCQKHPMQPMNMFCREVNCKVTVCASCGLLDHQGHDLVSLAVAIGEQSSTRLRGKKQELVRKRMAVEAMQKMLTDNFKQKEKDMQEAEEALHKSIKSRYAEAHFYLKQLYQSEMDRLTTSIESINSLTDQMTGACEFVNNTSDMSNPTQLMASQSQMTQMMNRLCEAANLPETTSDKTNFAFTAKHYSAMAQIQESLQNFCNIDWQNQQQELAPPINTLMSSSSSSSPLPELSATKLQEMDPNQCTIQLRLPSVQRWGPKSRRFRMALVQAVDSQGQHITTGGANVEATQGKATHPVQDNNDGTYTFEYLCITLLRKSIAPPVSVEINGIPMKGTPFDVQEQKIAQTCQSK